jgi:3-oxoadipate CoA-transferase, beta subunit
VKPSSRDLIAARAARDIPSRSFVNLGIGIPTLLAQHIPVDRDILIHSENGLLGMGPPPAPGLADPDIMDAGKNPATVLPGGSIFDSATSFMMVRGGHLTLAILGAFQVSARGDLANWSLGEDSEIPSVGGAMDLACGAQAVWVLMTHVTREGGSRLVSECSCPLTASGVVKRIYTDLAIIDVAPEGFVLRELTEGVDFETVRRLTAAPLLRG